MNETLKDFFNSGTKKFNKVFFVRSESKNPKLHMGWGGIQENALCKYRKILMASFGDSPNSWIFCTGYACWDPLWVCLSFLAIRCTSNARTARRKKERGEEHESSLHRDVIDDISHNSTASY